MSNEIEKKLFEQIFGHILIKLAKKTNICKKQRRKSYNC